MQLPKSPHRTLFAMLLVLFSSPLIAQDNDPLDWTETKDQWGQVMFCQLIYKMPEVRPRLYSFDIESCDKAGQLMTDVVSRYSKQDQVQIKAQAERHAYRLGHNTSEPYHSVPACRDFCGELATIQDKRND